MAAPKGVVTTGDQLAYLATDIPDDPSDYAKVSPVVAAANAVGHLHILDVSPASENTETWQEWGDSTSKSVPLAPTPGSLTFEITVYPDEARNVELQQMAERTPVIVVIETKKGDGATRDVFVGHISVKGKLYGNPGRQRFTFSMTQDRAPLYALDKP